MGLIDNRGIMELEKAQGASNALRFTDDLLLAGSGIANYSMFAFTPASQSGGFCMPTPDKKYCPSCLKTLPIVSFGRNKSKPDGLQSYCLICRREVIKYVKRPRKVVSYVDLAIETKRCCDCKEFLSVSLFYKNKSGRLGIEGICKNCRRARQIKTQDARRVIREAHAPVVVNELGQRKCIACSRWLDVSQYHKNRLSPQGICYACKECKVARSQSHYEANKEEHSLANRLWRLAHVDAIRDKAIQYRQGHKEQAHARESRRRAIKAGNGGSHTAEEWEYVKQLYNYSCLRCGKREPEIKLTRDHIVPLKLGGHDSISNLQPLCSHCNSSKNATIADYRIKPTSKRKHV